MHKISYINYPSLTTKQTGYLIHFEIQGNKCVLFFYSTKNFSIIIDFFPSFLIKTNNFVGCEAFLKRNFEIKNIELIEKIEISEFNHLNKPKEKFYKIYFENNESFFNARTKIKQLLKNEEKNFYNQFSEFKRDLPIFDGIYEFDIPFDTTFLITHNLRVGKWYEVEENRIKPSKNINFPSLKIFAFDIETSKAPFLFPDSKKDEIMMISVLTDKGYLIVNREIIGKDIEEFTYQPTNKIGNDFKIFNEKNEKNLLIKFYELIYNIQPEIVTTYNGDLFDIPYIIERSKIHALHEFIYIFDRKSESSEEVSLLKIIHLDCFKWVKRDSYLPMGSQGLKSVTQAKLKYFPDELDPESLVPLAKENPQLLASYSVSDSVACHAIFVTYVNLFIFSLCTLIPLTAIDVLEKGSGTLCEALLVAKAEEQQIVIPQKNIQKEVDFSHMTSSVNYVGGHVESLRSGIYRKDFFYDFTVDKDFLIEVAEKMNFNKEFIKELDSLEVKNTCKPLIFHLDVGAMYPNIILTNRLQPIAVKSEEDCLRCDFYHEKEKCQRKLKWIQRVEYYPPTNNEVQMIKEQLENEEFKYKNLFLPFKSLPKKEREALLNKRIIEYSKIHYRKRHITKEIDKESVFCQREIPFYLETVRNFRDQRSKYKKLAKESTTNNEVYESLQIAHKCVLNSFYGYVMRKGSRWFSMEMAAVTCYQGKEIIKLAKEFIERFGIVLELDTDGIWCLIPEILPLNYLKDNILKSMLNFLVLEKFTNYQYYLDPTKPFNSIEFEIDGPYSAMIIPSSVEENKLLKKKYLIFNQKNEISELKGFEIKRRGELNFVKKFQKDLFANFMKGNNLEECYKVLGEVCEYWLSIIEQKASFLSDEEVFELFSESKSISKEVEDYENQNIINITVANRLSEFLEIKTIKGMRCEYIISDYKGPTASKAIPVQLFDAGNQIRDFYLKKWIKKSGGVKDIIDWEYYKARVSNVMLKIVVLPALFQKVKNPVISILPPKWCAKPLTLNKFLIINELKQDGIKDSVELKQDGIKDCIKDSIELKTIIKPTPKLITEEGIFSLIKYKKKEWIKEYFFSELNSKEDILSIKEEKNKFIFYKIKNNKIERTEERIKNYFYLEFFNNKIIKSENLLEKNNLLKRIKKINNKILIEIEENNSNQFNEFINHLAIKNIYEKEIPLIYKLNYLNRRKGNLFNFFIVSSFKYQKYIFYIFTFKKHNFINEFNSHESTHSKELIKTKIFVDHKYNNFEIFNYKKLFKNVNNYLAFYTDNLSKLILKGFNSLRIKIIKNTFIEEFNISLNRIKGIHLQLINQIEKENEVSCLSGVNLNGIDNLDYLFYIFLKEKNLILENVEDTYNVFNSSGSIPGFYGYSLLVSIKNALINAILENQEDKSIDIFYEFIYYLFKKDTPFRDYYYLKIEEWLLYKSKIIPQGIKNKFKVIKQKYLIEQIKKIKEINLEITFFNFNILIINSGMKIKNQEFINYLKNKIEIEIIKEFEEIIILNEFNYIFKINSNNEDKLNDENNNKLNDENNKLNDENNNIKMNNNKLNNKINKNKIKVFGDIKIPEKIIERIFLKEKILNDDIYSLIIKEKLSFEYIKPILEIMKLNEEISTLESNCYKLFKRSLFEKEKEHFRFKLICKCKNENQVFTNGTNKIFCNKCYSIQENEMVDEFLIEEFLKILNDYLRNEKKCNNCKKGKERRLEIVCKCGGAFSNQRIVFEKYIDVCRTEKGKKILNELNVYS